ncbi:MAG: LysR family transcriptional regulator [Pseudomonadota bacterium]
MDRLLSMQVFAKVVDTGSFSRAAEALDMSAALVSRYVADLEAHLRTRLLHRTTRKLSLTESGAAYYDKCVKILAEVDEAEKLASSATTRAEGTLRLHAPVAFAERMLAYVIPKYSACYPQVRLDLAATDRVPDLLAEGFDLGLVIRPELTDSALVVRRIGTIHGVICAAPAYLERHGVPATLEELAQQHVCLSLVQLEREEWALEAPGGHGAIRARGMLRTNSLEALRVAGCAGMGIVFQPSYVVAEDLHAGRLVQLFPEYPLPELNVYAAYPSRRYLPAKVKTFVDFLQEEMATCLALGSCAEARKNAELHCEGQAILEK